MKIFLTLSLILVLAFTASAQESNSNSLSFSMFRLERNSQSIYRNYNLKFVSSLEYQRQFNRWKFGLRFDYGLNKIEEDWESCRDHLHGTAYLKESNIYTTAYYSIASYFDSKLSFDAGLGAFYSNLNYQGKFIGGWGGATMNDTYHTFGLAPTLRVNYFATSKLFFSFAANHRAGLNGNYSNDDFKSVPRWSNATNVGEFRVGIKF